MEKDIIATAKDDEIARLTAYAAAKEARIGELVAAVDDGLALRQKKSEEITTLRAQLQEALKYGAPRDHGGLLAHVERPCDRHDRYWTTISGACMACRAEDAERQLRAMQDRAAKDDAEIATLREQVRLAVEALKPFAEHANWYDGAIGHVSEDDYQFCAAVGAEWCGIHRLNLGHLRQARAALRASGVDLGGKGG